MTLTVVAASTLFLDLVLFAPVFTWKIHQKSPEVTVDVGGVKLALNR